LAFHPEADWVDWVDRLADRDAVVVDDFLPESLVDGLREALRDRWEADRFEAAGIGAEADHHLDRRVRGDRIHWLDEHRDPALAERLGDWFALRDELIDAVRRLCFLPVSGSEFHWAVYPPGTFYRRHVDRFRGRHNRLLSAVVYLNRGWVPGDGGELRLWLGEDTVDVEPLGGRLVLFRSDTVPHEVLETRVERWSLTGWLLRQPPGLGFLENG
jgi:SM-20-related protein